MSPITTFILGLLIGIIIWWIIDSAFWRPSAQELRAAKDSQERMQVAEAEVAGLKAALHKEQMARSNAESRGAALQSALRLTESAQMTAVSELDALHMQTAAEQESATDVFTTKLKSQLHKESVGRENAEERIIALQSALSMTESAQMTAVSELDALHVETSGRKKPLPKPTTGKPTAAKSSAAQPAPQVRTAPEKVADPDDLTVVEGIGPKIDGVLKAAGITTYVQLSETAVETLEEILAAAGGRYRLASPATWPQQAQLAAEEAWPALKALKGQLKGGRRKAK